MSNVQELDQLYKRIAAYEMVEKLKNCGVTWHQSNTRQFYVSVQEGSHVWDVFLTKDLAADRVVLDFRRDMRYYFSMNSEDEPIVWEMFKEIAGDDDYEKDRQLLRDVGRLKDGCIVIHRIVMNGGILGGGTALVGGRSTYNETPSGGIRAGGAAAQSVEFNPELAYGGVTLTGTASVWVPAAAIARYNLGTGKSYHSGPTVVTIPNITTNAGDLLIVLTAGGFTALSLDTGTYGGRPMTHLYGGGGQDISNDTLSTSFFYIPVDDDTTADVIISASGAGSSGGFVYAVLRVEGLGDRAVDQAPGALGSTSTFAFAPSSPASTVKAKTYVQALLGEKAPFSDGAGTWGGGFTQAQFDGLTATIDNAILNEAYQILSSPTSLQAQNTLAASRFWGLRWISFS